MEENIKDAFENFRQDLYEKRGLLRQKMEVLRRTFPDHCGNFNEKPNQHLPAKTSSVAELRQLRAIATFTILDSTLDTFLLYEELVNEENEHILREIVKHLHQHSENVFGLTLAAEKKDMWGLMLRNILTSYPSVDRWLLEHRKTMAGIGVTSFVSGIVLIACGVFALGVASFALTTGICLLYWQRKKARQARMAQLTYDNIQQLKMAANPEKLLETLTRLRTTCNVSYTQWVRVLPTDDAQQAQECGICYRVIVDNELLGQPLCGNRHDVLYHFECLRTYEKTVATFRCPMCRAPCLIRQGVQQAMK
jgi:hypothetical protein